MMDKTKIKQHRNDIILVAVIFTLAIIGFVIFRMSMTDGKYVSVSIDGKEKYRYSLDKDIEKIIATGENGQNTNVLVIKNGTVDVKSASCPDKICVGHREISKSGETIVCLPHKVVISITDE